MRESININIEDFRIDKSAWSLVKFGDVAIQQKKAVDRDNTELSRYVKGEHMGSEDLHLREWGELTDEYLGPAFIRIFEEGDILYGSRRTYLRKVVIAPFSGITSNTTFVIKANEKKIDKRLLPFIMMSEGFTDHSVKNSKGSVNPYINWKDIANYEFLLPPKDQQAKLAELLWAMDAVVEKEVGVLDLIIKLKHSFRKQIFLGYDQNVLERKSLKNKNSLWEVGEIGKTCEIHNHLRKPINKSNRNEQKGNYPYYGPTSVIDYISEYRVDGEYVLIGEDGDHFLKYHDWNMTQYVNGKFNVNNHAHLLKGSDKCLTKWIYYSLQHRNIIPHITRQGASRYKLNKQGLLGILIFLPPIDTQRGLIRSFDALESGLTTIKSKIAASKSLQKSLINQIF